MCDRKDGRARTAVPGGWLLTGVVGMEATLIANSCADIILHCQNRFKIQDSKFKIQNGLFDY